MGEAPGNWGDWTGDTREQAGHLDADERRHEEEKEEEERALARSTIYGLIQVEARP